MSKNILKSMLQHIINDRHDEASEELHQYMVAKTRPVIGIAEAKYISEQEEQYGTKILDLLKKDCAPFLEESKNAGFLYRGIKSIDTAYSHGELKTFMKDSRKPDPRRSWREASEIIVYKKDVRSDRTPRDTDRDLHKMYDDWFKAKFGFRARSESMFCFPRDNRESAKQYGTACMVFPIGDFDYVWSPEVSDLQLYAEIHLDDDYTNKDVNDMLDGADYKNTNFKAALNDRREIMVRCKSYYAIPVNFEDDISELLKQ